MCLLFFFFFKQKTAYEMRISDWSSDVCSSDLWLVDAQLRLDVFRRQTDLPADQPTALIDPVTDIRRLDLIRVANCVLRRAEQIADRRTRRQAGACAAKSASCLRKRCPPNRPEERRVGNEGVGTGRDRGSTENK